MSISAKIIADSISSSGKRIITFVLRYPRFVHPENLTHRVLSRNSSSSRAIPVNKITEEVSCDPAWPEYFGAAQKGMQAEQEVSKEDIEHFMNDLNRLRKEAILVASSWKNKIHKQTLNRYLEPWAHISVLCTATEWGNFFNLRAHKDAQPEIRILAVEMLKALVNSNPTPVKNGDWHMPFRDKMPVEYKDNIDAQLKICTARAARVSYLTFDGKIDPEKDFLLHDQLSSSGHWSPFEHCAQALENKLERSGNFIGWKQYRKQFPQENQEEFDPIKLLAEWTKNEELK